MKIVLDNKKDEISVSELAPHHIIIALIESEEGSTTEIYRLKRSGNNYIWTNFLSNYESPIFLTYETKEKAIRDLATPYGHLSFHAFISYKELFSWLNGLRI